MQEFDLCARCLIMAEHAIGTIARGGSHHVALKFKAPMYCNRLPFLPKVNFAFVVAQHPGMSCAVCLKFMQTSRNLRK